MDVLLLEVTAAPADSGGGFQVLVFVNDVETTSIGAGLGMDPYDVLIPNNRFIAGLDATTVPVARCECGVYGCGATDVTITREGDRVRWQWHHEKPMQRDAVFDTTAYDREVDRASVDLEWETADRAAGRLILTNTDRALMRGHGLDFCWVDNDYRDQSTFRVCLIEDGRYQVFVNLPWADRSPKALAEEFCTMLGTAEPHEWSASWHAIDRSTAPPTYAGPDWTHEIVG